MDLAFSLRIRVILKRVAIMQQDLRVEVAAIMPRDYLYTTISVSNKSLQ